jgi:chromosome segregation ATPase
MMSPLSHLVLASVVAALAFFFAGLLLRRPRRPPAAEMKRDDDAGASARAELAGLRADRDRIASALAESERRCQAETEARKSEEAARRSSERERASAEAEVLRLSSSEKTLAERLRVAEDNSRATLEQVESNAAAWEAEWQGAKAQHQQREQALRGELEQLHGRWDLQAKENQRLVAACQQHAAEMLEAQRAADEARRALVQAEEAAEARAGAAQDLEKQRRLAEEGAEVRVRDLSARLETASAEWQAKLAKTEAAWQARVAASERADQTNKSALQSEVQRLAEQVLQWRDETQRRHDQNQRLELALRTADEALAAERAQARSTKEALRAAEDRLRETDRLARENAELRGERARLAAEAKATSDSEGETRDAKVALAAAQAKLAELEQVLEENRRLRDEVGELRVHREAQGELERLNAAHKQLRLDAELMARRLQELQHDRAELVPLRAQAAEAASLSQEVEYLRRREKELEAQLYASGFVVSREMRAVSGELLVQTPVSDMETNLDSLVGQGGPRTAVLADAQGFLIAGAGESVAQEGLAAFAAVAGEMVSRARMLLPLAEVESVRVTDANNMVLTCHLFDSDGQGLGVATLGPGEPPPENTRRAIAELAVIVGGGQDDGTASE